MDNEHQQQPRINWGSIIGWLIFFAVIAGGPLLNGLRSALGGTVPISPNLLPFIILGLVILGALVSIIRGITRRSESASTINHSASQPRSARSPFPSTYQPSTYDDDTRPPQSVRSPFPSSYQASTYRDAPGQPLPMRSPFPSSTPDLEWHDVQVRRMSLPDQQALPPSPRFDPVISPLGAVIGVAGLIALVGIALYVFGVVP
jgi:hypothetical protein